MCESIHNGKIYERMTKIRKMMSIIQNFTSERLKGDKMY